MPVDLAGVEDRLTEALTAERDRQRDTLSLIASENHASEGVLRAQGSVLTNKYAEGRPGSRYYEGCPENERVRADAREIVNELCAAHPLYDEES